ncbi:MAG TPA: hypothetical protein VNO70_12325, partial [Blastocatellia bacterium]|nr:hypothetical protein [Blastocatellia bacterium]
FYSPPLDSDSVTVEIKKLSGRAAANIRVCKVTAQGASTSLDSFSFAENDAEGKVIKKTYSGLSAHALQLAMQAQGGLLRHFEFTLTVTKNNR